MGAMIGNNPTNRSKLGTKRHILTDKEDIPLSVVISPASTHDIKLVIDVVDNSVIKRRRQRLLPSHKSKLGTRRRLRQHLCLDKAYISEQEEQELIKRGYVLHIPIKKKKKKGGDEGDDEDKTKEAMPNRKKHSPKRWVVGVPTHGTTDLENCLPDMRKNPKTLLD